MDSPFIICKAAAGSGKTFTLVREYLKMSLSGPDEGITRRFRGILAITFTNKAANEMKHRIMSELDEMATNGIDPDSHTMGAILLAELNRGQWPLSASDLQHRAQRLQSAILHHYTDLSVFTIDSFMHRIVRTFAHDLGKPVNFEVMTDRQLLVDEVVSQLMSLVGTPGNEDLTQLLTAYADSNMESDKGYNVEGSIAKLAELLFDEDIEQRLQQLSNLTFRDFRDIHRFYTAENRKVEAALRRCGEEGLEMLRDTGLDDSGCYQGAKGFLSWFRKLAAGTIAEPNSYVSASLTGGKLTGSKCPKNVAADVEALRPRLEALYDRVMHILEHDMLAYNTRTLILERLYSTALLGRMYSLLTEYSRSNEVMHLSEFNRVINSIVEDEDNPAPFIFERLGNRYQHFLIDEFQDTSVMQWHNLVPLVENGLAHSSESLVVGDAKQAIYRFRQGDVRQFVRLPQVDGMVHHGRTLSMKGNYRQELLDTNYRTSRAVVEFNNDFFSWLVRNRFADNALAQDIYIGREDGSLRPEGDEELRQKVSHDDEGYVGISFVDDTDKESPYAEALSIIERMVNERGYRYGDIMVLARDNRKLAQMSAYMNAHSTVPQTSRQSFLLRSSDAAMAVIAALRHLHNPSDRTAVVELQQRLENLGLGGVSLQAGRLRTIDLYDCCEEIIRLLRLDGIDMPHVGSLLNQVAAFTSRHRQDIGEFLEWFDEHESLSAASSDQLDAVRLLTIHKAKGLEAPVVICLLLKQNETMPLMWVDVQDGQLAQQITNLPTAYVQFRKDMPTTMDAVCCEEMKLNAVDDLNVLYVALTRPREQLYIVSPQPGKTDSYGKMIYDFLDSKERTPSHGVPVESNGTWRAGFGNEDTMSVKTSSRRSQPTAVKLQRLSFGDWTERVSIASPSEKAVTPLLEDKVRFGIYVHDLLAGITHAADVDAALSRFRMENNLDDNEMHAIEKLVRMVVSHPDTARFFADGYRVANEVSFFDGGTLGRPDRVVFADGETWVVDFKTGVPMPQHKAQVNAYCQAIKRMGYPSVSGYLVYLNADKGLEIIG